MNDNIVQIGVALVIVNLVAWGGFVLLQDDDNIQEDTIANVSVTINYNGAEADAVANTNKTIVVYNVTVIGDTSAFNATVEASKGNFGLKFTWYSTFNGAFIDEIDGISGSCAYWELLHNGESSMVGASDLLLVENDSITWKYNTDYC